MQTDITTVVYDIHDLTEYINWIYFFHAWGFQPRFAAIADIHGCDACRASWLASFPVEDRAQAAEAMQLHKEANRMLNSVDGKYKVYAIYRLMNANSDGDNLLLEGTRFPLLRQQTRVRRSVFMLERFRASVVIGDTRYSRSFCHNHRREYGTTVRGR